MEPVGNSFPISASLCSIPTAQLLPQVYGNSTPAIIYCVTLPGAGYSWPPTSYLSASRLCDLRPTVREVSLVALSRMCHPRMPSYVA